MPESTSVALHSRVALLFVCLSRILFFAMDASLAPVARSSFPDAIGRKKSNTIVSIFERNEQHERTLQLLGYLGLWAMLT